MPLDEFLKAAEALRPCGYRPVRLRPYAAAKACRSPPSGPATAARGDWPTTEPPATSADRTSSKSWTATGRPADVAGYLAGGEERYAVVWVKTDPKEDVRLYVGVSDRGHQAAWQPLLKAELPPATLHTFTLADGEYRFSSVWRKPSPAGTPTWDSNEQEYADKLAQDDQVPLDVSLTVSRLAVREVACEVAAWLSGAPWAGLGWRSQRPALEHPAHRYAGTWQASATLEYADLRALDPASHQARCRELVAAGYGPAALSVTEGAPGGPLVATSVWHRPVVAEEEKERLAKRQANAAVALLRLERPDRVWPLLRHRPDPRVRSYILARVGLLGADPQALWRRFEAEPDVSARRALLLCLGEFGQQELPDRERARLLPRLFELYRDDPDSGIHSSAAWLLGQWGQRDRLREIDRELARRDQDVAGRGRLPPEGRRWYVNGQGQTMGIVPGPVEFWMGLPRTEAEREGGAEGRIEMRHYRRVGRTFALVAHEVTVEQFRKFRNDRNFNKQYSPTPGHPVNALSWFEAAAYCNWLSKQEGIPEDQWCYVPIDKGAAGQGMRVRPDFLSLSGYRLPTEAEWEYACLAGAVTSRYYGETEELLGRHAWYTKNSLDRGMLLPGSLRPNDRGLFDMLGNAGEWCQDPIFYYPSGSPGGQSEYRGHEEDIKDISDSISRLLRGGALSDQPRRVRSAYRNWDVPANLNNNVGLRPARTFR